MKKKNHSLQRHLKKRGAFPKKEKITEFSRNSRRNFKKKLNMVDSSVPIHWIHLTYPSIYPSPGESKSHLFALRKRMTRRWPRHGAAWRLEFQKRGAPHYHIFVWGVPYEELKAEIEVMWFEVVGSGDEKHLRAGTRVQYLNSSQVTKMYVSKYMTKTEGCDPMGNIGRCWGFWGKVPWSKNVRLSLPSPEIVVQVRDFLREITGVVHGGLSFYFVKDTKIILDVLKKLLKSPTGDNSLEIVPF